MKKTNATAVGILLYRIEHRRVTERHPESQAAMGNGEVDQIAENSSERIGERVSSFQIDLQGLTGMAAQFTGFDQFRYGEFRQRIALSVDEVTRNA